MSGYTVYNTVTGSILRYGECPDDMVSLQPQGETESVLPVESKDETSYVDLSGPEPIVADRIPLPHSVAGNVISGLPIPTHVLVEGPLADEFDVPDGEVEYVPPVPGTYTLTLTAVVMYLPAVVTMEIS